MRQPTPDKLKPFPQCWFETSLATFEGYLPLAVAKGVYKVAPSPLIVNKKGLEGIQEGVKIMRGLSENDQEVIKDVLHRIQGDREEKEMSPVKIVITRS